MNTLRVARADSRRNQKLVRCLMLALLGGSLLLSLTTNGAWAGCRPFSNLSLKPSILTQAFVRFNHGPLVECDPSAPFGGGYDADFSFSLSSSHTIDCNMDPCDESGPDGYGWIGGQNSFSGTSGCTGFKAFGAGGTWTIDFKVKFHEFGTNTKKKWGRITIPNMGNHYFLQLFQSSSSRTGWLCRDSAGQPGVLQNITSLMEGLPNP